MPLIEINAHGEPLSAWFIHKAHALLIQRGFRDKHGPYVAVCSSNLEADWAAIRKMYPTIAKCFTEKPLTTITEAGKFEIRKQDDTVLVEITNLGESNG